jgi:hypothetical protein
MALPGFTAEASVYTMSRHAYASGAATRAGGSIGHLALAQSDDDCAQECAYLRGCARRRCECECNDGIVIPDTNWPCRFHCRYW